jgi:hypothetical protein
MPKIDSLCRLATCFCLIVLFSCRDELSAECDAICEYEQKCGWELDQNECHDFCLENRHIDPELCDPANVELDMCMLEHPSCIDGSGGCYIAASAYKFSCLNYVRSEHSIRRYQPERSWSRCRDERRECF